MQELHCIYYIYRIEENIIINVLNMAEITSQNTIMEIKVQLEIEVLHEVEVFYKENSK